MKFNLKTSKHKLRKKHIEKAVLNFLNRLNKENLSFPLDIKSCFNYLDNCKLWTYQYFSDKYEKDIIDVINFCESESACTFYNKKVKKYLVLYNSCENKNSLQRQRWTLAHELAHILLGHSFIMEKISFKNQNQADNMYLIFEKESDYFSSLLLSPIFIFEKLNIKSPIDVENTFLLSAHASFLTYKNFLTWKDGKSQTYYDKEFIDIFSHLY